MSVENEKKVVRDIIDVIDAIEMQTDRAALFEEFSAFTKSLGFSGTLIGHVVNPAFNNVEYDDLMLTDWSSEFQRRWRDQNYMFHDPILKYAMINRSAFNWSTAYTHATRFGQKILDESRDFQMAEGLAIPVSMGANPLGMVSLVGSADELSVREMAGLELVSIHACNRLLKIATFDYGQEKEVSLTPREVDVLHYVAGGKTNWEIAHILEISEYSIKDHLLNARRKLDAANRAHSVMLGMRGGHIIT